MLNVSVVFRLGTVSTGPLSPFGYDALFIQKPGRHNLPPPGLPREGSVGEMNLRLQIFAQILYPQPTKEHECISAALWSRFGLGFYGQCVQNLGGKHRISVKQLRRAKLELWRGFSTDTCAYLPLTDAIVLFSDTIGIEAQLIVARSWGKIGSRAQQKERQQEYHT